MKKIIIFSLILFNIFISNSTTLAGYDNHTLQAYESTLADNTLTLPKVDSKQPASVQKAEQPQRKYYSTGQKSVLDTKTLIAKAIKSLVMAVLSFLAFVFVILFISKTLFKKKLPPQAKRETVEQVKIVQDDATTEIQDIVYDFYKRNQD